MFLLHVYRGRIDYPELKRAVRGQAAAFKADTVLIEDKASGTQLIQELVQEGMHSVQRYEPKMEKIMRMHSVTGMIENGFVHLPENAHWLDVYRHELAVFPKGKYDDQADSTSQALDWVKQGYDRYCLGYVEFLKQEAARLGMSGPDDPVPPRGFRW